MPSLTRRLEGGLLRAEFRALEKRCDAAPYKTPRPAAGDGVDSSPAVAESTPMEVVVIAALDLIALNIDLASVMQSGRWKVPRMPMR